LASKPVIDELKKYLETIVAAGHLDNRPVKVSIGTLTVDQAIGNPERRDFPLIEGKEVMIEAEFEGCFGQAFTDRPHEFEGTLNDILKLNLRENDNRAIFIATLNAVTAHLGIATGTRHCRNEQPELCAAELAEHVLATYGRVKVGLIGLQPAILDHLVRKLGEENVRCTDLNPDNVGKRKYGAEIWDGRTDTERLIEWSDLLLATSSTIVNSSYDGIKAEADRRGKQLIIFGVTGAGPAALLELERLCFQPN
jgi:hypothetical protein